MLLVIGLTAQFCLLINHEFNSWDLVSHESISFLEVLILTLANLTLNQVCLILFALPFFDSCIRLKQMCIKQTSYESSSYISFCWKLIRRVICFEKNKETLVVINDENVEDTESLTLESFDNIENEFIRLTKAWSPMLLSIFFSESIILINAGFVVAKFTLSQDADKTYYKFSQFWTVISLLVSSGGVLIYICFMSEETHNKVTECVSLVK